MPPTEDDAEVSGIPREEHVHAAHSWHIMPHIAMIHMRVIHHGVIHRQGEGGMFRLRCSSFEEGTSLGGLEAKTTMLYTLAIVRCRFWVVFMKVYSAVEGQKCHEARS